MLNMPLYKKPKDAYTSMKEEEKLVIVNNVESVKRYVRKP